MGIVKLESWEWGQIHLFSKTVLDYGNRSADVCPVMQAVEQVGHSLSLSMCIKAAIEKMSEDLNAERHISTFKSNVVHTITNNELSRLTSLAGHWTGQ